MLDNVDYTSARDLLVIYLEGGGPGDIPPDWLDP